VFHGVGQPEHSIDVFRDGCQRARCHGHRTGRRITTEIQFVYGGGGRHHRVSKPVPFSGTPITDTSVCAGIRNTWHYTQTLTETTGVAVSFSTVTDRINGGVLQSDTVALPLRARGSITYNYRWCLISSSAQTAQATFSGVDATGRAVTYVGPVVTLQAGPSTSSTVQAGRRNGGGGTIP
jgi:hypothetical protein